MVVAGNVLLTLTVVVGLALMATLSYSEALLRRPGPLAAEKVVNLSRTSGFRDIGDQLEREGVVDNAWAFVAGVMLRQARQDLKAGEYLFPRGASLNDVIGIIVTGKSVLHQITVPEGLTSEQTVARLLENDVLTGPIREIPREGSLLPETYRFNRGITREQIVQRMAADQRRVVAEIWAKRAPNLPLHSPEDLVTLASIVEKETGKPAERARVAAVFLNRLSRRMKLQSDPTIIYGLVGGKGALGRPIYRSDIERPTAYNTYVIDGLPPGPIANPGRAALEAAANPADTRDLYFVADGTGGHAFAETLEEHNRNVARWREIERQQNGQAAPPAAAPAPTQRPTLPPRSRN
ncbi:endolytic transglycosylase MltG [Blastochloris sulfoviridis]